MKKYTLHDLLEKKHHELTLFGIFSAGAFFVLTSPFAEANFFYNSLGFSFSLISLTSLWSIFSEIPTYDDEYIMTGELFFISSLLLLAIFSLFFISFFNFAWIWMWLAPFCLFFVMQFILYKIVNKITFLKRTIPSKALTIIIVIISYIPFYISYNYILNNTDHIMKIVNEFKTVKPPTMIGK